MTGRLIYVVAVAEPLANLPQIITIIARRDAGGVSVAAWLLYLCFAAAWLWHGLRTGQRPVVVAAALFAVTDAAVIAAAAAFGGRF